MTDRPQTTGEEIANSVSHGLGLLAAVFVGTMVLLYLTSTLYHALPNGRAKRVALLTPQAWCSL